MVNYIYLLSQAVFVIGIILSIINIVLYFRKKLSIAPVLITMLPSFILFITLLIFHPSDNSERIISDITCSIVDKTITIDSRRF